MGNSSTEGERQAGFSFRRAILIGLFSIGSGTLISVELRSDPAPGQLNAAPPMAAQIRANRIIAKQACMSRRRRWMNRSIGFTPESIWGIVASEGFAKATCVFE